MPGPEELSTLYLLAAALLLLALGWGAVVGLMAVSYALKNQFYWQKIGGRAGKRRTRHARRQFHKSTGVRAAAQKELTQAAQIYGRLQQAVQHAAQRLATRQLGWDAPWGLNLSPTSQRALAASWRTQKELWARGEVVKSINNSPTIPLIHFIHNQNPLAIKNLIKTLALMSYNARAKLVLLRHLRGDRTAAGALHQLHAEINARLATHDLTVTDAYLNLKLHELHGVPVVPRAAPPPAPARRIYVFGTPDNAQLYKVILAPPAEAHALLPQLNDPSCAHPFILLGDYAVPAGLGASALAAYFKPYTLEGFYHISQLQLQKALRVLLQTPALHVAHQPGRTPAAPPPTVPALVQQFPERLC